ncbi:MAG: hypothetical protein ACK2T6_00875 [Anaerolineae bacterium]
MSKSRDGARCPECNAVITFSRTPRVGLLVTCRQCEEELEVVQLDPMRLDYAQFDYDEDEWDDDWSSDDDDEPADDSSWKTRTAYSG